MGACCSKSRREPPPSYRQRNSRHHHRHHHGGHHQHGGLSSIRPPVDALGIRTPPPVFVSRPVVATNASPSVPSARPRAIPSLTLASPLPPPRPHRDPMVVFKDVKAPQDEIYNAILEYVDAHGIESLNDLFFPLNKSGIISDFAKKTIYSYVWITSTRSPSIKDIADYPPVASISDTSS